jgi:membrane protease YdiL (CAAX protease family)
MSLMSAVILVAITLLIGGIEDRDEVFWYHYLLEFILYVIVIACLFLISKFLYPKLFSYSEEYSFKLPSKINLLGTIMTAPLVCVVEGLLVLAVYALNGNAVAKSATVDESLSEILIFSVCAVFTTPFVEELSFRFMALSQYRSKCGKIIALIFVSLIFGLLHATTPYNLLRCFIAGLVFGIIFLKTHNIWYSIALHFASNLFTTLVGIAMNIGIEGMCMEDNISVPIPNIWWSVGIVIIAAIGVFLLIHNNSARDKGALNETK